MMTQNEGYYENYEVGDLIEITAPIFDGDSGRVGIIMEDCFWKVAVFLFEDSEIGLWHKSRISKIKKDTNK